MERGSVTHPCLQCGEVFKTKLAYVRNGFGRFCSRPCVIANRHRPAADRFWSFVEKTETCWLWKGALRGTYGYGAFWGPDGMVMAHRYAWELANGPIPADRIVMHRCDVAACVRNDGENSHLVLGTMKLNSRDMVSKGRGKNKGTIVTPEIAAAIRLARSVSTASNVTIGRAFGISQTTVSRICAGLRWD